MPDTCRTPSVASHWTHSPLTADTMFCVFLEVVHQCSRYIRMKAYWEIKYGNWLFDGYDYDCISAEMQFQTMQAFKPWCPPCFWCISLQVSKEVCCLYLIYRSGLFKKSQLWSWAEFYLWNWSRPDAHPISLIQQSVLDMWWVQCNTKKSP